MKGGPFLGQNLSSGCKVMSGHSQSCFTFFFNVFVQIKKKKIDRICVNYDILEVLVRSCSDRATVQSSL